MSVTTAYFPPKHTLLREGERIASDEGVASGVMDALGSRFGPAIDATTAVIARKLVATYDKRYRDKLGDFTSGPLLSAAEAEQMALVAGLTPDVIEQLKREVPFLQIANNLRDYFSPRPFVSLTNGFLRARVDAGRDDRILDAGCSAGRSMLGLADTGATMAGIDIDGLALSIGAAAWAASGRAPNPMWIRGDLLAMPFADGVFTHVVSSVVLGFVPMRAAMAEIRRVSAPGAMLAFTTEGPGFVDERAASAGKSVMSRIGVWRWRAAARLSNAGVDWQGRPVVGRLAAMAAYLPETLRRIVSEGGFDVDSIEVLDSYNDKPRLIGVVARRR